ncbi:MAG: hypothetical protein H0W78_00070 [Planctomycetes bacterium]|nr:hypothetical protein [Planctomycetota bacterium]
MFRRRTDQVYSTLQQVQRRITEQNGNPGEPNEVSPGQPQSAVNLQPLSQALPTGGVPALTSSPAMQPPFAGVPAARMPPGGNRYVLQISGDLAMLLVVMWLISMALMFVLGQHWSSSGGAGLAPGAAGNRDTLTVAPPPGKRLGDWVYVLKSQPSAPVDAVNLYEVEARKLNDVMRQPQNSSRGWKPYFGVRKPVNGGVELVFGVVEGVWGVDKGEFATFAKLLAEPASKSGGGYASARWVQVDQ